MKSIAHLFFLFIAVLSSTLNTAENASAAEKKIYQLATASLGGTYHPVGEAIGILSSVKLLPLRNIGITAVTSAGSGENIKLLRENKVQFAILMGLFGYYAWTGTGPIAQDGPQKDLRSISMLWQNAEHFTILKEKAKTGTIDDIANLKGMQVSFGKKGSGTIGSNAHLLKNLGFDIEKDFQLTSMGFGESAEAMKRGEITSMALSVGVPAPAVSTAFMAMPDRLTLLSFTEEQAKKADGGLGFWKPYVIPAGTYAGEKKDITTIAQPNFLVVRSDLDEETVYLITKLIYENLRFLQNIHRATLEMSSEKAVDGLPIPLHPGALKYYREIGLKIPENLVAK